MNLSIQAKIGFSRYVDFLVLMANWFAFGYLFQSHPGISSPFLFWVLLASLLSMLGLGAIGYFEHYIPKPELTGVLSLLLVLPFSAFYAKWLIVLFTKVQLIRYPEALRASVWTALAFETSQWVSYKLHRAMGKRWTLVTHLLPAEFEALNRQIQVSGMSWWISARPFHEVMGHNGSGFHAQETVVISRGAARELRSHAALLSSHLSGQQIVDFNQLLKEFRGRVNLSNSDAWTFILGSTYQSFPLRLYFHLKTYLEPLLALMLLLILSPLWIALGLAIMIVDGAPILYRQQRMGYRGRSFPLLKFRTMAPTAESAGPQWANEDDPRVTRLGRWLRKTRFDELPQLLNVLRGELSFVGPRPERPEFYSMLNGQIPLFPMRLLVRPGITGWAQVKQGYVASVSESRRKLEYDLYYVQHMSPRLDLRVIVTTMALMMRGNSGR